jgi:hypothetical protein
LNESGSDPDAISENEEADGPVDPIDTAPNGVPFIKL